MMAVSPTMSTSVPNWSAFCPSDGESLPCSVPLTKTYALPASTPPLPTAAGAASAYEKFARVEGDFATVSVAAVVTMDGGTCHDIRLAVGACAPVPIRSPDAEEILRRDGVSDTSIAAASEHLAALADPVDDFRGSGEYRLKLIPVLVARAIEAARNGGAA